MLNDWIRNNRKWFVLILLVFQTTVLVLLMRYTLQKSNVNTRYLTSTTVVLAELLKLVTCFLVLRYQEGNEVYSHIFSEIKHFDTIRLAVPGLLYLLQNNLLFIALSNLDAAVYQVTYQFKILTTALFSVLILGRSLTKLKIFSLIMLTIGIALVQYEDTNDNKEESEDQSKVIGFFCVVLASLTSGFAGVYLEKIMKDARNVSLWIRNIQLGLFGFVFGMAYVFLSADGEVILRDGFFRGYSELVFIVAVLQAVGGLLIASVIKYADNLLKGFATSVSIILSTAFSAVFFNTLVPSLFFLGVSLVTVSVVLYGYELPPPNVEKKETLVEQVDVKAEGGNKA
jgi:UDP-sugar transporter A1/2/3